MAAILQIKNYREPNINYVLKSWAVLLLSNEEELMSNNSVKKSLKELLALKAYGSEEAYITGLQQAAALRIFMEQIN